MADITTNSVPTVTETTSASTVASIAAATSSDSVSISRKHDRKVGSWLIILSWNAHRGWIAMVIVLVIAFILISIAAVLVHRRYLRRQDKMTSGFNAGITQRSVPMAESADPLSYRYDGANDSSQSMPGRSHRGNSAMYLPKAGERDLQGRSNADIARDLNRAIGDTPEPGLENGRGMIKKGKARMQVDEVDAVS